MRYHHTPVRKAVIKRPQITNVGEDAYTVDGNVNWCRHYGKQHKGFWKTLGTELLRDPAVPLWVYIYLRKTETLLQKDTCAPVFIAALFIITKICK